MTIEELIQQIGSNPTIILCVLIAVPLIAFLYGRLVSAANRLESPHKYAYSSLIYLACIPGGFAAVLTAYSLFFLQSNLLQVNPLVYFLPIISMAITIAIIRRDVVMDAIPGFDRLYGLLAIIGVSFFLSFLLIRTRVWFFLGGSFKALLIIAIGSFLLLRWGSSKVFRS
ncbi:MAG: hypothetical protein AAFP70_01710 [Calditrichota bacterium]